MSNVDIIARILAAKALKDGGGGGEVDVLNKTFLKNGMNLRGKTIYFNTNLDPKLVGTFEFDLYITWKKITGKISSIIKYIVEGEGKDKHLVEESISPLSITIKNEEGEEITTNIINEERTEWLLSSFTFPDNQDFIVTGEICDNYDERFSINTPSIDFIFLEDELAPQESFDYLNNQGKTFYSYPLNEQVDLRGKTIYFDIQKLEKFFKEEEINFEVSFGFDMSPFYNIKRFILTNRYNNTFQLLYKIWEYSGYEQKEYIAPLCIFAIKDASDKWTWKKTHYTFISTDGNSMDFPITCRDGLVVEEEEKNSTNFFTYISVIDKEISYQNAKGYEITKHVPLSYGMDLMGKIVKFNPLYPLDRIRPRGGFTVNWYQDGYEEFPFSIAFTGEAIFFAPLFLTGTNSVDDPVSFAQVQSVEELGYGLVYDIEPFSHFDFSFPAHDSPGKHAIIQEENTSNLFEGLLYVEEKISPQDLINEREDNKAIKTYSSKDNFVGFNVQTMYNIENVSKQEVITQTGMSEQLFNDLRSNIQTITFPSSNNLPDVVLMNTSVSGFTDEVLWSKKYNCITPYGTFLLVFEQVLPDEAYDPYELTASATYNFKYYYNSNYDVLTKQNEIEVIENQDNTIDLKIN